MAQNGAFYRRATSGYGEIANLEVIQTKRIRESGYLYDSRCYKPTDTQKASFFWYILPQVTSLPVKKKHFSQVGKNVRPNDVWRNKGLCGVTMPSHTRGERACIPHTWMLFSTDRLRDWQTKPLKVACSKKLWWSYFQFPLQQGRIHGSPVADSWTGAVMQNSEMLWTDGGTNTARCRVPCSRLKTWFSCLLLCYLHI